MAVGLLVAMMLGAAGTTTAPPATGAPASGAPVNQAPPKFEAPAEDRQPVDEAQASGGKVEENPQDLGTETASLGVVGRVVRDDGKKLVVRTDAGREIDILPGPDTDQAAAAGAPKVELGDRVHASYRVVGGKNELVHVEVLTPAPPQPY